MGVYCTDCTDYTPLYCQPRQVGANILCIPISISATQLKGESRATCPRSGGRLPRRQLRSFCCVAEAARLLTDAGAVSALLVALRRIPDCDPACGAPFGMEDALEQLQAGRLAAA